MCIASKILTTCDRIALKADIQQWAKALGFAELRVTDTDLKAHPSYLAAWLKAGFHGDMQYMQRHQALRSDPQNLVPGTLRILSVRMNYLPPGTDAVRILQKPDTAYIARYALGRDYHKLMRKRLEKLAQTIKQRVASLGYRAFVDSAPVLERAVAERAGLGWIGKSAMLLNRQAGSWFFLGELLTDLDLPVDAPMETEHCGRCRACLERCPTQAFDGAYRLDARKCISYLTIENKGAIPEALRPLMGNRIFGCDDCQLVCPWNRFASPTEETDFHPRHHLDNSALVTLFAWSESEFLTRTQGSAIRRTGYLGWLRNIAVALGNAPSQPEVIEALKARLPYPDAMVQEHVRWALAQHPKQSPTG